MPFSWKTFSVQLPGQIGHGDGLKLFGRNVVNFFIYEDNLDLLREEPKKKEWAASGQSKNINVPRSLNKEVKNQWFGKFYLKQEGGKWLEAPHMLVRCLWAIQLSPAGLIWDAPDAV